MTFRVGRLWQITAAATIAACFAFGIVFYPRGVSYEERYAFAAQRKKAYDTMAEGRLLHDDKKFDEAEAKFREAIALDPAIGSPHYLIGTQLLEQERYEAAIQEFDLALQLDRRYEHIMNNRGVARMHLGDLDGAMRDFTAAIDKRAWIRGPRANCGFIRLHRGEFAKAIEDFDAEMARFEKPSDAVEVYIGRGIARASMGDLAGAEEDLTTAVEWAGGKRHLLPALKNRAILREKAGNASGAQADWAEFNRLKDLSKESKEFERPLQGADEQPIGRNSPQ